MSEDLGAEDIMTSSTDTADTLPQGSAHEPDGTLPTGDDATTGRSSHAGRLNSLRAAVLGANDGIVSTAALVIGVAGATTNAGAILTAGIAGLSAGALSMAVGEYVSVSAQRDTERALLDGLRNELASRPAQALARLASRYERKGLTPELAAAVAQQLHRHDALDAHAETELGINPDELTSPWVAAVSSMIAFTVGALLPLLAIVLAPADLRVPVTFVSVVLALALTGFLSGRASDAPLGRVVLRNVTGGGLAMAITFGIGSLVGHQLG